MAGRRVLITGISSPFAGQLAERLRTDDGVEHVIGIDRHEPAHDLTDVEFVRAELAHPVLADLVESDGIDTIAHLGLVDSAVEAGGRSRMKDINVIGTMHLLGAAQKAPRVRRVVVRSATAVYGSGPNDPALFREDDAFEAAPGGAHGRDAIEVNLDARTYGRDAAEVERYARNLGRQRGDVAVTILRFAELLGPTVESPVTRVFALPVVPTLLGCDPRLQFCHEHDAADVAHRAAVEDHPGVYNVAGPGVVYLSQALRIAGKLTAPVPLPVASGLADFSQRAARAGLSADLLALLRYGRAVDIDRLRTAFGYTPAYSTREALRDFVASGRAGAGADHATLRRLEKRIGRLLTGGTAPPSPTATSPQTR